MRQFYWLLIFLFPFQAFSQGYQPVFPDLDGQELVDALVDSYSPQNTLGSSASKDVLYGEIYNENDSLSCVYTGYTIYLDPALDPSEEAFDQDINLEHTYPKAKGAGSGLPSNDMHHLHPSRVDVNSDRGSFPFGDIDDNESEYWYWMDQTSTSIPGTNIDEYSEFKSNDRFEPREDHKGNVARAYFYFYTIYRIQADAADPDFFWDQRFDLCNWHFLDPVDQKEWDRTFQIAAYQSDVPNPFVLDCTLAFRTYCSEFSIDCTPTSVTAPATPLFIAGQVTPNPAFDQTTLRYLLPENLSLEWELIDVFGKSLRQGQLEQQSGEQELQMDMQSLPAGLYFFRAMGKGKEQVYQIRLRVQKI
jgi:endonuclease I